MSTWNNAARSVVKFIFSLKSPGGLSEMREVLDAMVATYTKAPYDTTSDWAKLGAAALACGRTANLFPEDDFSEEIVTTLVRKQTDYGKDNVSRFGIMGLLVRMNDKVARLENLTSRGLTPENESLRDNYMDVIGYAAIGMMWEQETFNFPLEALTVAESR